jgi:DNA repair exonuclease SbcCD nuclease subunit
MESAPVSFLPSGFDYYAGGHVHIVARYSDHGRSNVIYPGPLFPNSFSELEALGHGGFFLYDQGVLTREEIRLRTVRAITTDVDGLDVAAASEVLRNQSMVECSDAIVLLRVRGTLKSGNVSDLPLREIVQDLEARGAHVVLRNTTALQAAEFAGAQLRTEDSHSIEENILREHAGQLQLSAADGVALARSLLRALSSEPHDGEKVYEYEERMAREALALLRPDR